jgi:periplasmic mercuric ion binding protein
MKHVMKNTLIILALIITAISCNNTPKKTTLENQKTKKIAIVASYKSLEVEIEGMTCEIGCARTIQSKLSKVDGVTYSKVNFEAKKGQFTFDVNKISKEDIIQKINQIGGGDLYIVTKSTDVEGIVLKAE